MRSSWTIALAVTASLGAVPLGHAQDGDRGGEPHRAPDREGAHGDGASAPGPGADATATEAETGRRARGRARFRAGVHASDDGQWDRARAAFAEAYELLRDAKVLLNLAGAQVRSGALVAGAHSYLHFLAQCERQAPALCEVAHDALAAVRARLPQVRLVLDGAHEGDTIRWNGQSTGPSALGTERYVDPGAHEVVVLRDGEPLGHWRFGVQEGETHVVSGSVQQQQQPSASATAGERVDGSGSDEPSLWSSPLLWIAAGAVVLGGAITAGVLVASPGNDRHEGSLPPGHVTTP